MSDELKERNILKLLLIVKFACATLDMPPVRSSGARRQNTDSHLECGWGCDMDCWLRCASPSTAQTRRVNESIVMP
jgi:hypothetical protein